MALEKVKETAEQIKVMKIQGSSAVRKAAVKALRKAVLESRAKTALAFRNELKSNALLLLKARPTEPETRTAIRIILKAASLETDALQELKNNVIERIESYEEERKNAMQAIAEYGFNLIPKKATVFTHCHSHTVEGILLKARKKIERVVATETRPRLQGRITARNLSRAGIPVTLIVDSAASRFMHEADLFFTGADAVLADGSVVNKIGTKAISIIASQHSVPHYAATSSHCFDPLTYFGIEEKIEERPAEEVWEKRLKNVTIRNPAFDVTEAGYVKGIVTELGVFEPRIFALEMYRLLEIRKRKQEFLSLLKLLK